MYCTIAGCLHRLVHVYVYTYRERKYWWILLIQDRVIYIHRWSCLEGNIICWHLGLWVSMCIRAATDWRNRKMANFFLAQCPTIHLLILPFSQPLVSQGMIAAGKPDSWETSHLHAQIIIFLPFKKVSELHRCSCVMEMPQQESAEGSGSYLPMGLGGPMVLHKSLLWGSQLSASGLQL